VDLKRQGRAEEHIALSIPTPWESAAPCSTPSEEVRHPTGPEVQQYFVEHSAGLSGADIEAVLARTRMKSALRDSATVMAEDVQMVLDDFVPPSYPTEIELQNLVAGWSAPAAACCRSGTAWPTAASCSSGSNNWECWPVRERLEIAAHKPCILVYTKFDVDFACLLFLSFRLPTREFPGGDSPGCPALTRLLPQFSTRRITTNVSRQKLSSSQAESPRKRERIHTRARSARGVPDGTNEIMPTSAALRKAQELGLDLVLIAPTACHRSPRPSISATISNT